MPIKADLWQNQRFHKSIPHRSNYPVITNVAISITGLVTWNTDIPSTSQLAYGTIVYMGLFTNQDPTLVTSHSVQIPNTVPGTTYFLKVLSFYSDALSISDLYVFTYPVIPSFSYPAFILFSPDGTRWSIVVIPGGNLDSEVTPTGPAGAYVRANMVILDTDSINYWALTIDNTGHLITASGGSPTGALNNLSLYDSIGTIWTLTVSPTGDLITT